MFIKKFSFAAVIFITAINSYAFKFVNLDNLSFYKIEQQNYCPEPGACFKATLAPSPPLNSQACSSENVSCNCTLSYDACIKFKITNLNTKVSCTQIVRADGVVNIYAIQPGICNLTVEACNPTRSCQGTHGPG